MNAIRQRLSLTAPPPLRDAAVNLTFACDLGCVGCNRACFVRPPHTPAMTVERLGTFLDEALTAEIPLRWLRIVGGEPTLHPQFFELLTLAVQYTQRVPHTCTVRLFSNRHSPRCRKIVDQVRRRFPAVRIFPGGAKPNGRVTFPWETRTLYVSPKDLSIDCPRPCPWLEGRGECGFGVDQLGYTICPVAGTIDSLLGLGARATRLTQLQDLDFCRQQAATICSHCGAFMNYAQDVAIAGTCRGTPLSPSYHQAINGQRPV